MRVNGTMPDEIRWPAVDDYKPSTRITVAGEDEDAKQAGNEGESHDLSISVG
jgi:hypothetical protein